MATYNYLPGVQVATLDGGLVARTVPTSKAVLIFGTAGQGPANEPYQVPDQATTANLFGLSGSLVRGMAEVAIGGADNIILFRIGTSPAVLTGIGKSTGSISYPGYTITFGSINGEEGSDYSIWYNAGVLYLWNGTQLVFANDVGNDIVVNTGDSTVTGSAVAGTRLGSGSATLTNAITVSAAVVILGSPAFTASVTGLGMTGQQLFIALAQATSLLDVYPVDEVVAPDVIFDNPNVAFHVGAVGTETNDQVNFANAPFPGFNDPTINPNALDWLKITTDTYGNKIYQWASQSVNSAGATVSPMTGVTTPAQRIAAGFGEVNFGHMLATFCQKQEIIGLHGTCLLFLGTSLPAGFNLTQTRSWVGFLPQYNPLVVDQVGDADIVVTVDGAGLLGIPYLVGCTAARLNYLCLDYATGRTAGLFQTENGEYDGEALIDTNGNLIDIGAYLQVMADVAILSNSFSIGYGGNLANYEAGFISVLDETAGLTNKPANVTQLWRPNSSQLDSATFAGVNFLRFKGVGNLPCFLHDQTSATNASDYKNLLRQRIKGLVADTIRVTADPFIGSSTTDGLQLQSLQTALTKQFMVLQKRGYIGNFSFKVNSTPAQQRIGHASIYIVFTPADELIQLDATIALSQT